MRTFEETSMAQHLWNHEKKFWTGVVPANEFNQSTRKGGIIGISFEFNMKICCVFQLELPQSILMSTHNISL